MTLPKLVCQEDDLIIAACGSFPGIKVAANQRCDSKHRKKPSGGLQSGYPFRGACTGQIPADVFVDGEVSKLCAVFQPVFEGTS